jgi:signal transduction histidine kinase
VVRAAIVQRWRAVLAALRRPANAPPPSRWAWVADVLLALVLATGTLSGFAGRQSPVPPLGALGDVTLSPPAPPRYEPASVAGSIVWILLALATALPVAARRRYPLTVFWVVIVASEAYHGVAGFGATFTFAACVIVAYSVVMYSSHRVAAVASVLAGAALIAGGHRDDLPRTRPGLIFLFLLIPMALAANAAHTRQQRIEAVEAQRETETRLAAQRERARIAQELHDVVTHNVSVMLVQAGAARTVLTAAPEQARQALLAIESGGRAAMHELRHVMDLLSKDGDPTAPETLTRPPGLGQLPTLAARVRDAGMPVEVTVTGTPGPLPGGVDLAAYRVVQEALTNAMKHAAGAQVAVRLGYGTDVLRVEVSDTGGLPSASARAGNGRGLIGLRERLAIYAGTLDAGPLPRGGYQVRAVIPLERP